MNISTHEIVRRTIVQADRLRRDCGYNRATERTALMTIAADIRERSPDDPAVERLKVYNERRDREPPARLDSGPS